MRQNIPGNDAFRLHGIHLRPDRKAREGGKNLRVKCMAVNPRSRPEATRNIAARAFP